MKKEKNYITLKGFNKLQKELEQLLKVERPEVTKTIAWAASNGDRSENADYIYGKKRLREIDRRIRFLTSRLDNAHVIEPEKIVSERIQFGATVTMSDEEGNEKQVTIVGVDEIQTEIGHLSWKSPVGGALIGKFIGDVIIVKSPKGEFEYEILTIEYRKMHED